MSPAMVLIAATATLVFSATADKRPHLVFDKKTVQMDTLTQGETREIAFTFINKGKSDLLIDHTRSSCGCTIAFSTKKRVAPDSGGAISVKFNSLQFRGAKTKSVYVYSNDPDRPVDTLTFHVFVRSEIDCEPRNIVLDDVVKGVSQTTAVALYNPGSAPITVTALTSPDRFIRPELAAAVTLKPGDTARVNVVVTPPDSSTSFTGSIGVFTKGGATDHPFSIRVFGKYKK
jgi:hypothetical protein